MFPDEGTHFVGFVFREVEPVLPAYNVGTGIL